MHELRHVEVPDEPGRFARGYARLAATGFGRRASRVVSWRLDPVLLGIMRGRVASTLVFPTALLETRGARTGRPRRNAVIYFHDGELVTVVASNAGAPAHPAWFHNLRADPDVVLAGRPMRAVVVDDDGERARLWALADRVFPAFADYRRDAESHGRTIPIVQLRPA
ncbi:MAG TPA: nitroreductase/quinone reductase family protein [Aquihabitans sp.]|jgi:deazaflavin-dependent oxidoreductase (nitroreductase family)|nr:nitroreductase/quinone reductase family protein [Aquihabitans sp.]